MPMSGDEVEIVPYQDGPYLVRGPAVLRDQDGREIHADRPTIALCRCGKSRMRPFCDGTHQLIRFRATSEPEQKRRHDSPTRVRAKNGRATRPAARANGSIRIALQEAAADIRDLRTADHSIAHAVSLLSAAQVLLAARLASSVDGDESDWTIPCVCLLRGTIAALANGTGHGVREVSNVIEQLSVLVALLEARGGHA